MSVSHVNRKALNITESGRSTDFIPPKFGFGCLLNCTYCYQKRNIPDKSLSVAVNVDEILEVINNHTLGLPIKEPNQTDVNFWTYDISCNEDFALHAKYHDWKKIFGFFRDHPIAKASLATKVVPESFLEFNPEGKVRIRFSLMPQRLSSVLEPNTALIIDRIKAIDRFIEAGYDVDINFSPVIVNDTWLQDYIELFQLINTNVKYKNDVNCEVIFLTHNKEKHLYNLQNKLPGEDLLWSPNIQETKISYGGRENLRYGSDYKSIFIKQFKIIHGSNIPWCNIRYCF